MKDLSASELFVTKEYYIADYDELSLEASLLQSGRGSKGGQIPEAEISAMRLALQEIDRLKISGKYEETRAKLKESLPNWDKAKKIIQIAIQPFSDPEIRKKVGNFAAGLRSPNTDQRKRFQALLGSAELGSKPIGELMPFISALEPAMRRKGRPKAVPAWRNEAPALDEIRVLVSKGISAPEAAREIAQKEGKSGQENRSKYFEKLYRARQKLRE